MVTITECTVTTVHPVMAPVWQPCVICYSRLLPAFQPSLQENQCLQWLCRRAMRRWLWFLQCLVLLFPVHSGCSFPSSDAMISWISAPWCIQCSILWLPVHIVVPALPLSMSPISRGATIQVSQHPLVAAELLSCWNHLYSQARVLLAWRHRQCSALVQLSAFLHAMRVPSYAPTPRQTARWRRVGSG